MNKILIFNLMVDELKALCVGPQELIDGLNRINKASEDSDMFFELAKLHRLIQSLSIQELTKDVIRMTAIISGYTTFMTEFIDNEEVNKALKRIEEENA